MNGFIGGETIFHSSRFEEAACTKDFFALAQQIGIPIHDYSSLKVGVSPRVNSSNTSTYALA